MSMYSVDTYLAIGEKFPVKILATGNSTVTHAALRKCTVLHHCTKLSSL